MWTKCGWKSQWTITGGDTPIACDQWDVDLLINRSVYPPDVNLQWVHLEQVTGNLDDCACDVETIDAFNNDQLFPKLQKLLESDYFRFYQVTYNWTQQTQARERYRKWSDFKK